jgi:peptide/nickel transport system permease protein
MSVATVLPDESRHRVSRDLPDERHAVRPLARLRRDPAAVIAAATLAVLLLAAVLAPWLAPYDPTAHLGLVRLTNQSPSLAHPFGTDLASRDVLSRVLWGARVSLGVGLLSVLLSVTLGTAYGATAGYLGGRTDGLMMRLVDALLSIPRVLLLLAVLALWGAVSVPFIVCVIGLTGWFATSRVVRASVLALREREFVMAAHALGAPGPRVLVRHILPNLLSPIIVAATLGVGNVIILEAGLSYLGLGVRQPQASWGNIIQDGADQIGTLWWISLFPGLAIVITVMACNALGDALRDALDPRELAMRASRSTLPDDAPARDSR